MDSADWSLREALCEKAWEWFWLWQEADLNHDPRAGVWGARYEAARLVGLALEEES